jgi:hypothetical protein
MEFTTSVVLKGPSPAHTSKKLARVSAPGFPQTLPPMKLNLCATEILHQFCELVVSELQAVSNLESVDLDATKSTFKMFETVGLLNVAQPHMELNIAHLGGIGGACADVDPAGQTTNPVHLVMVVVVGQKKPAGQRDIEVEFAGQNDPREQGVIELTPVGQKNPGRQDTQALKLIEAFKDIVFSGQLMGVCEPGGQYVLTGHSNLTELSGQKNP